MLAALTLGRLTPRTVAGTFCPFFSWAVCVAALSDTSRALLGLPSLRTPADGRLGSPDLMECTDLVAHARNLRLTNLRAKVEIKTFDRPDELQKHRRGFLAGLAARPY